MLEDSKYYVIKKKAVPEVLLKVLEVQKLLDAEQAKSIQEATETVGISRSSYYKYKDDIFPFSCRAKRDEISRLMIEVEDQPGVMATVLQVFANYKANILNDPSEYSRSTEKECSQSAWILLIWRPMFLP